MKIRKLLNYLSEFSPTLLCGYNDWDVQRLADDSLPIYDEGAVYVDEYACNRCHGLRNSGTVITSEGNFHMLSPMVINVIIVSSGDLGRIKKKLSVLLELT